MFIFMEKDFKVSKCAVGAAEQLDHIQETLFFENRDGAAEDGIPNRYSQARIGLALFDLSKDIGETTDVKDKHPEVVAKLQKLGEAIRAELGGNGRRGKGQRDPGRL